MHPPPLLGACRHGIRSSIPVAKPTAVCKWAPHLLHKILFGWAGRGARIIAAACTAVGCVFGAVRDNEGNGLGEGDSEGDGKGGSEGDGVMAGGVSGGGGVGQPPSVEKPAVTLLPQGMYGVGPLHADVSPPIKNRASIHIYKLQDFQIFTLSSHQPGIFRQRLLQVTIVFPYQVGSPSVSITE